MSWEDRGPRGIRCVHEAGHAVMACHYGMEVKSVTVPKPDGKDSHCWVVLNGRAAECAAVFAGGEVAEKLLLGKSTAFGSYDDIGRISEIGRQNDVHDSGAWREDAFTTAKEILSTRVETIETVAQALWEQVELGAANLIGLGC